jgi:nucleoside-diphosphate-sugar epimerase
LPLPLGGLENKRSFIALDNLVGLIHLCVGHPAAANQLFLAADEEDLSTTELIRRIGAVMGRPARLFSVSHSVLARVTALVGKQDLLRRLCGSLQVDASRARAMLGWSSGVSVDDALRRTVQHFLSSHS